MHGVREIGPVDAWVVGLLFEYLVGLVSAEEAEWEMERKEERESEGERKSDMTRESK